MQRVHVLVIDDDEQITTFLRRALAYAGFTVDIAATGEAGLQQALTRPPDVVILDVMMPGLDGLEVCQRFRVAGDVPILLLTAKDAIADRVRGLECGADDYLIKPFALAELIARVKALARRHRPLAPQRLQFADVVIDLGTREAWRGERRVTLTAREFDLLAALLRHPRQVLSRERLLDQVWGLDSTLDTRVLEVYVGYLRTKLEAAGEPRLIQTVRGVGYAVRDAGP